MKIDWYRLLPQYLYQQSPTDWEWDALLNDILNNAKQVKLSTHTAEIDGVTIWTSNWPYAYGTFYTQGFEGCMPSVKTRHRLRNLIEAGRKKQFRETIEKLRNK